MMVIILLLIILLCDNVNSFNIITTKQYQHHKINMISRFDKQDDVINKLLNQDVIQVFQLMKRNPLSFTPNQEQATLLLNNLNKLIGTESLTDTSKFYDTLFKTGVIKAYGCMNLDGPLNGLRLPELEYMLYNDPPSIFEETGINSEHLENLEIPNYNTKGYTASTYSMKEDKIKTAYHCFIVASLQTIFSITLKDTFFDPTMILLSIVLLFSSIIVDGPFFFDGTIFKRQIKWMAFRINTLLNPAERKKDTRRDAATFIVAYLVGTPIKRFESNVNDLDHSFFISPDGPKVDLQDPALHIQSAGDHHVAMDMNGLNRLSAAFMASAAVDAFDGWKVEPLNSYTKNVLAFIALRSIKPAFSSIPKNDFPQKLTTTISIWGFLQSSLILKEVGHKVLDAVQEVFENGGGVGDAIFSIEANLPDNFMTASPTSTRRHIRKMTEETIAKSRRSIVPTLSTILEARAVPEVESPIIDSEITLIQGTDRLYTKNELILRTNATMAEVDDCAKTLMHLMAKVDKIKTGRVQPQTQMKIKEIATKVLNAKLSKEVDKVESEVISNPILLSEASSIDTIVAYESLGLSKLFAHFFSKHSMEYPILDNLIDPFIEISNAQNVMMKKINKIEEWWLFYGSVVLEYTLGIQKTKFINSAWDASNMSTGIENDDRLKEDNKATGITKKLFSMTNELKNILKLGSDDEAEAVLARIKKIAQRDKQDWKKMIVEDEGTFKNALKDELEKNMIRMKQINDRMTDLNK